jgi:hypothetical protein
VDSKEKGWLFQGLQNFVNLEDEVQCFLDFFLGRPDFRPVDFRNKNATVVTWGPELHALTLAFRDMLRDLWITGSNEILAILLGTHRTARKILSERGDPSVLARVLSRHGRPLPEVGLAEAVQSLPADYFAHLPEVQPDWRTGGFLYNPITDFQRAVSMLHHESWRAKICANCSRYFVADKSAQTYCSAGCSDVVKRTRALEWWRAHGEAWRKGQARNSKQKAESKAGKRGRLRRKQSIKGGR